MQEYHRIAIFEKTLCRGSASRASREVVDEADCLVFELFLLA
jgi:hypothetical protein